MKTKFKLKRSRIYNEREQLQTTDARCDGSNI